MTTLTPYNNGLDWGSFPSTAQLPNVSGSATQSPDVRIGARAYVPGSGGYICTAAGQNAATWESFAASGPATDAADVTYTPDDAGDWSPAPTEVAEAADQLAARVTTLEGSLRAVVGPLTCTTAVGSVPTLYAGGAWVAHRAGTITAVSGAITVAAADDSIVLSAVINGVPCTGSATFPDGGTQYVTASVTAGNSFVAGDVVYAVTVGSASLSNTPDMIASVEITYA